MKFNNNKNDGIFTIHSDTTMTVRVKLINLGAVKATMLVDGFLRYDCTKPEGDHNWLKRAKYNLKAPNKQYRSIFYNLKIRMEIKKRKWIFFGWKCKRCE